MKVCIIPNIEELPERGGVREHLLQLYRCAEEHPDIHLVDNEMEADVLHVESSYRATHRKPDVYVCHGGFLPRPLKPVLANIRDAKIIVSVAKWLVHDYLQKYANKTVVIPNGIRLGEWENLPSSGLEPGYVLYAKEWEYYIQDFVKLSWERPSIKFVSTVWPNGVAIPANAEVIGLQSRKSIRSVINDAACLVLPGLEVCPTMLLEAWACGTPVLASWEGGSADLMDISDKFGFVGGYLYRNYAEMRHGLDYVLDNSKELGVNGYLHASRYYQWPELFERYVRLYEAIANDAVESIFEEIQGPSSWNSGEGGLWTELA